MKMACLFLSRSHLNGSMSLDIICCVRSLFWACTDGWFAWPSFPEVSSASDQMFILPPLRLCFALFFLFLTLETNLLQTLSSRLKLCILPSSDTHPANISAVNCAEPSPWQLLPFLLPVPPNILFSGLCIPRHKMEVTTPYHSVFPPPRGTFNEDSMWRLVECRKCPFPLPNQHGSLQRSAADWLQELRIAAAPIKLMGVVLCDQSWTLVWPCGCTLWGWH